MNKAIIEYLPCEGKDRNLDTVNVAFGFLFHTKYIYGNLL